MDLEKIIQDSLTVFIQSHIPTADLSGLDDIVFSYVTSVLEELGSPESFEETFDMETFMEMMEAYVPGFAEINSDKVCEMMISLSEKLREAHNKQFTAQNTAQQRSHVHSEEVQAGISNRLSCSPVKGAEAQETCGGPENSVEMLMEMFPACIVSQAKEALSMARGNLEEAAQLILEEKVPQESANAISQKGSRPQKSCKQTELKEFILQKYMMVDSEEDCRTHRPPPPKEAPKKLIRYIDNQVVSTRGERYKDIKVEESEEMKRTYINLKPARKYKFH